MFFFGIMALVFVILLLYWLANAKPETVRGFMFSFVIVALIIAAIVLALMGRYLLSFPLLLAAFTGWRRYRMVKGAWQTYQSFKDKVSGGSSTPNSTQMDRKQALDVLGLKDPIDQKMVNDAWQKLMQKLHPDSGGNDYLASQLNAARETLLNELKEKQ
mgnify:CR=1 FL=1